MDKVASSVTDFVQGPLFTWIKTFYEDEGKGLDYCQLCDGVFLHEVMLQIDPRPPHRGVCHTGGDNLTRIRNLDILVRNVKAFYEDVLGQFVVVRLPDVITLGREPNSDVSIQEVQKLLLLVLGCAVQCSKKEEIVDGIKRLDLATQHSIVECIQQVTDQPETVWLQEWNDYNGIPVEQHEAMYRILVQHLKNLIKERDDLWHNITELTLEKDCNGDVTAKVLMSPSCPFPIGSDKHHYGVELADCKAKSRRLRQELEDKTETLAECKEELEHTKTQLSKIKQENLVLVQDARAAKTYRDELDILKERANKVDKLENEIQRYKDKMNELEFCKSRIEELREDNRILIDTKEMLEDQLDNSRKKVEIIPELENDILKLKSKINELILERDMERDRVQELLEENAHLQMSTKQCMNESVHLMAELDHLRNQASPDQGLGDSLCDQLNKDAQGRLMKLELENQRLLSLIDQLRDGSFHEHGEKILELEKENKRLSLKVEYLLENNSKETQKCLEFEQRHQEISRETTRLQQVLDMVRISSERQQTELQREKTQLVDLVTNLRQRNEKSNDVRLKDIETENRRLIESNQDMKSQISRLQFEKEQVEKISERLHRSSDQLLEMESQKTQMERENTDLHKAIAAFKVTCDSFEKLEQDHSDLQMENKRLSKTLENLQNTCLKVDRLEQDNIYLTIENQKLTKSLESMKNSSQKMIDLEQEKQEIQRANQLLKKNCEALKVDRAKYEQMEMDSALLNTEVQKMQKSLDSFNKKVEEIEQENQELESENQKLQKTVESYKVSTRKLNDLERENTDLEANNHKLEREKTSIDKEVARLKHALELKDSTIDEFSSKMSTIERENKRLAKEADCNNISNTRVTDLEKDNRDLVQQSTIDKKTLATLREDLVNEKIRTQQLANELDKLTSELQKIGLDKDKIMSTEQNQDVDRYKALENMMEEALKRSLEIKEEKIHALESRLQESANRNTEIHDNLRSVVRQYEALKQRHEEEVRSNNASPERVTDVEIEKRKYAKHLSELKDQLTEHERTSASVTEENGNLKCQLSSAREQVSALHSQVTSLQHQATSLTEQNCMLQSQTARLQVETSTLQSQNVLLTSQNSSLHSNNTQLEAAKEQLIRRQEEMQSAQESLVSDHEALQKLHEQLSVEYDSLLNELGSLKTTQKNLRLEYKSVVAKYKALATSQDDILKMRQSLDEEKELLKSDSKSLGNLRAEHSRLKDDFRLLHTNNEHLKMEYKTLQTEYKSLKTEYNSNKLKIMELQGEMADGRDQVSSLDVEVCKLSSKCEMLSNMNMTLNEERRSLMSQVSSLLTQYHELLTQALEDKEHFHEKEKNNMDKVNQLERQKAQLESKIIEQFMRMENYSPKKKGFGANLVRKVRRAGSELMNKVPRTRNRENERGERPIKSGENGENADNQDNSSQGSSFGQESPDSTDDVGSQKTSIADAKEFLNGENGDLSDNFERHGSIRRSRQSKPNSVFYTKVLSDEHSSTLRGSISSEEAVSIQADSQCSSGHFADVESCTSSVAVEAGHSPLKAKSNGQDEFATSRLSLGTPGSRRAVYYNDEHDTIPTRDTGSNPESPIKRSPAPGPKLVRHHERASIHGTGILNSSPQASSEKSGSLLSITSDYVISSATSSPVAPHRTVVSINSSSSTTTPTPTPRDWERSNGGVSVNRDKYVSMVELPRPSPSSISSVAVVSAASPLLPTRHSNITPTTTANNNNNQHHSSNHHRQPSNTKPVSGVRLTGGWSQHHAEDSDSSSHTTSSLLSSGGNSSHNHQHNHLQHLMHSSASYNGRPLSHYAYADEGVPVIGGGSPEGSPVRGSSNKNNVTHLRVNQERAPSPRESSSSSSSLPSDETAIAVVKSSLTSGVRVVGGGSVVVSTSSSNSSLAKVAPQSPVIGPPRCPPPPPPLSAIKPTSGLCNGQSVSGSPEKLSNNVVIGNNGVLAGEESLSGATSPNNKERTVENSIWYEYGCV